MMEIATLAEMKLSTFSSRKQSGSSRTMSIGPIKWVKWSKTASYRTQTQESSLTWLSCSYTELVSIKKPSSTATNRDWKTSESLVTISIKRLCQYMAADFLRRRCQVSWHGRSKRIQFSTICVVMHWSTCWQVATLYSNSTPNSCSLTCSKIALTAGFGSTWNWPVSNSTPKVPTMTA